MPKTHSISSADFQPSRLGRAAAGCRARCAPVQIYQISIAIVVSLLIVFCLISQAIYAGQSAGIADDRLGAGYLGGTADHVHVVGVDRASTDQDSLLIKLRIDPGYHINANPASDDYLIPTSVVFAGIQPERVSYPPPVTFKPQFSDEPINVYEGTVTIAASYPKGTLDREAVLKITVTVQACTDQICLPPAELPALTSQRRASSRAE